MCSLLKRLWLNISSRRQVQFGLLAVFIVVISVAEVVSLGAVIPFLAVLATPVEFFHHPNSRVFIDAFGFTQPNELRLPMTIAFVLTALVAGALRLLFYWASTRIAYSTGAELSTQIYKFTLYKPYSAHAAVNSGDIAGAILIKAGVCITVIMSCTTLLVSSLILLISIIAMLLFDPFVAVISLGGFASIYGTIMFATSERLLRNGRIVATNSGQLYTILQEGLGSIRDILIDGTQEIYCHKYYQTDLKLRQAHGSSAFINLSPKTIIEALGIVLIATIGYVLSNQAGGIGNSLPVLGALVFCAQRLLPLMQQAYGAWTAIQSGRQSLLDTLDLLDESLPQHAEQMNTRALPFERQISLSCMSFRYSPETPWVIKDLNLVIPKGARIGFIGETGSGKSTLLDIIMGLLEPTEGAIEIDGHALNAEGIRAWQAHIAHVPQDIFLADSSVEENIAFGIPKGEIDSGRVRKVAYEARIGDLIESWPNKFETFAGERGVRLSGGQRQRIGIARALYKGSDVIILDEASSALDSKTEQSVMRSFESMGGDITILMVAHRLTTLKYCTQIVEIGGGRILRIGTYDEIIADPAVGN